MMGRNVTEWMIKNQDCYYIGLRFARRIGQEDLFYKMGYFLFRKYPTEKMIKAQNFYERNKDRTDKIQKYLYDDTSREIYSKMISFRAKMDYRKFPKVDNNLYFAEDIIKLTDHEVFIDGGGYTGDTVEDFISRSNGNYNRVVTFEPDEKNYEIMKRTLGEKKGVICYKKGLYSKTTSISFLGGMYASSRVNEEGEIVIPVVAIDDIKECRDATFIKLDIEGAELHALAGAKETIIKNRPKLAVCLYHSDSDMLDIIEYVHKLVPDYRLHVRQHSKLAIDTVLYAVP